MALRHDRTSMVGPDTRAVDGRATTTSNGHRSTAGAATSFVTGPRARSGTLLGTPAQPVTVVVGLGYVGLPTALSVCTDGGVIGLDTSRARLEQIRDRHVDLLPDDLHRLDAALTDARLTLTDQPDVLNSADEVLICVPTPVDEHQTPDLTALRLACATVVAHARAGQTIMLTSTTFVGATRALLAQPLESRGFQVGRDIYVAFSPERIDPGRPEHPRHRTPRVLGGITRQCAISACGIASRLTDAEIHLVSSPEAAELTKLHENTFRAVNLALANELADICSALNVDPVEVIDAAATKPYGFLPHYPGPGVGGHCIPCDPHYLLWQLRAKRMATPVIEQAMGSIAARPRRVVERATEILSGRGLAMTRAKLIVVGVAYKPGVADLRGSSALEIIVRLRERGAEVSYWDPLVAVLHLPDGQIMNSERSPRGSEYDVVLLHTVQPVGSAEWVSDCPIVLDATYRFQGAPGCHVQIV